MSSAVASNLLRFAEQGDAAAIRDLCHSLSHRVSAGDVSDEPRTPEVETETLVGSSGKKRRIIYPSTPGKATIGAKAPCQLGRCRKLTAAKVEQR